MVARRFGACNVYSNAIIPEAFWLPATTYRIQIRHLRKLYRAAAGLYRWINVKPLHYVTIKRWSNQMHCVTSYSPVVHDKYRQLFRSGLCRKHAGRKIHTEIYRKTSIGGIYNRIDQSIENTRKTFVRILIHIPKPVKTKRGSRFNTKLKI